MQSLARSPAAVSRAKWLATARPAQITPPGDWRVWLVLAGRGFGKTRLGAEDVAWYGATTPGAQIAIIAPTFNDVRGTCFEGVSGLLACLPRELIADYNKSRQELSLVNGTLYRGFSADTPDRLRGPQFHRAWCDELAAWQYPDAWDQLMFGLRLGDDPRAVVTTTPRPTKLIRALVADTRNHVTRGSTFDNAAHLAPAALAKLREKYEGTRLGRQELYAEILDEAEGALWNRAMIERAASTPAPDKLVRIVVAVDPAATSNPGSDETGIIVAGATADNRAHVLADGSGRMTPGEWGQRVVDLFRAYGADRIVAEGNQGGEMVTHTLRTVWPQASVKVVHASRSKQARAEPVAALYEQGRISHAPGLDTLEDQMVTWEPMSGMPSPDRVDALVWAMTELFRLMTRSPQDAYAPEAPRRPKDYQGGYDAPGYDEWKVV
jgi:phage terminase large subunit-like protein